MVTFKKKEIIYRPYEPILKTIVDVIMIICFTYIMVNSFFGKTTISGHSMSNTLTNNEKVLINSMAYTFHGPERFDLIIFELDKADTTTKYVKRVIGLPGETIQIKEGRIYIDNKVLENDVITDTIHNAGLAAEPIKLGYDEYFVLGDNRNNSDDSRYSNIGLVKRDTIIGKPWLIIHPLSSFGKIKIKSPTVTETATEAATTKAAK